MANFFQAKNFIVNMYSAHPTDSARANIFDPEYLKISVGDTVTFIPSDPSHNSASKHGMIPEGAKGWNSPEDKEYTVSFTIPGVYGYVGLPDYEMGMVGMIVVENHLPNLEAAMKVRHPRQAKAAFRTLFQNLEK